MAYSENKIRNFGSRHSAFKHYVLLVKVFGGEQTEPQNLEICTNGLQRLLELRRLHPLAFKDIGKKSIVESVFEN
jgi:hypothetical protein